MPSLPAALRWPLIALLLGAGFTPPANAQEDAFSDAPPRRVRIVRRAPHVLPPPAVFSGYVPRNAAVPLYNEPPGLRARGYGDGYGR